MKRSLSGLRGFFASNRISSKKRVETMSAADKHVVGWPVPASLVDLTESIRSCAAMFLRAERDVLMVKVTNRGRQPSHVTPVRNPRPDGIRQCITGPRRHARRGGSAPQVDPGPG